MNWTNAQTNCSNLGDDWRLPTLVEFETSLTDIGRSSGPYVVGGSGGSNLFNTIVSSSYWTNTRFSDLQAYTFLFHIGSVSRTNIGNPSYVLCVKEDNNYQDIWGNTQKFAFENGIGQERITSEFIPNASSCGGNGTIYDTRTNLCWEKNVSTLTLEWNNARNRCNTLELAGGAWRVPEKAELITLLFNAGQSTTANKLNSELGFNGVSNSNLWSNTRSPNFPSIQAFAINMIWGNSVIIGFTVPSRVLCVKTALE